MRILYDNLLEGATLSATNEDSNYPIANVTNTTLRSKFMADTNSSVITCTIAEASTVSCFGFGNHNIDTLTITLTDSSLSTYVYNYTASDLKYSNSVTQEIVYLPSSVTDVTEIEYDITTVTGLYIGGLSAGQYLQMPYFDIKPKFSFSSSGASQKSDAGVAFTREGVALEAFGCTFNACDYTNFNEIVTFFRSVQTYKPFFVDRWESRTDQPVLFAQITDDISFTKGSDGNIFDSLRLEMEECK